MVNEKISFSSVCPETVQQLFCKYRPINWTWLGHYLDLNEAFWTKTGFYLDNGRICKTKPGQMMDKDISWTR